MGSNVISATSLFGDDVYDEDDVCGNASCPRYQTASKAIGILFLHPIPPFKLMRTQNADFWPQICTSFCPFHLITYIHFRLSAFLPFCLFADRMCRMTTEQGAGYSFQYPDSWVRRRVRGVEVSCAYSMWYKLCL